MENAVPQIMETSDVFVPGGQPSVTYVPRNDLSLERNVRRAIEKPHYFTSITGATKTGKTVLCRAALADKLHIWIEGGQISPLDNLWVKIGHQLKKPSAVSIARGKSTNIEIAGTAEGKAKVPFVAQGSLSAELKGSHVRDHLVLTHESMDLQADCIRHMVENKIILVIDDFHYVHRDMQRDVIRSLKGAVFGGLKVVLLSVWYRAYEAIAAEAEIAGRVTHVDVPEWSLKDLKKIPQLGFQALNVKCPTRILDEFADHANGSPQLMQTFCWELCFDRDISGTTEALTKISSRPDLRDMFKRISKDAGQSTYEKLSLGPQARSDRMQRPLKKGGTADIYEVVLLAIANTGPKKYIRFREIRENVTKILADNIPQQIEISNALKYLTVISTRISPASRPIDWNDEKKELVLDDPLFRFFLRWHKSDGPAREGSLSTGVSPARALTSS